MQKNKTKEQTYFEEDKEDEKEIEKEEIVLKKKPDTHYLAMKLPKKVTWSEDTVDNEHMHKKKSNICCIYHRPKLSPDDPDTSSCDSCDEKGKNAYERPNHYDRPHHDGNHGSCLKK